MRVKTATAKVYTGRRPMSAGAARGERGAHSGPPIELLGTATGQRRPGAADELLRLLDERAKRPVAKVATRTQAGRPAARYGALQRPQTAHAAGATAPTDVPGVVGSRFVPTAPTGPKPRSSVGEPRSRLLRTRAAGTGAPAQRPSSANPRLQGGGPPAPASGVEREREREREREPSLDRERERPPSLGAQIMRIMGAQRGVAPHEGAPGRVPSMLYKGVAPSPGRAEEDPPLAGEHVSAGCTRGAGEEGMAPRGAGDGGARSSGGKRPASAGAGAGAARGQERATSIAARIAQFRYGAPQPAGVRRAAEEVPAGAAGAVDAPRDKFWWQYLDDCDAPLEPFDCDAPLEPLPPRGRGAAAAAAAGAGAAGAGAGEGGAWRGLVDSSSASVEEEAASAAASPLKRSGAHAEAARGSAGSWKSVPGGRAGAPAAWGESGDSTGSGESWGQGGRAGSAESAGGASPARGSLDWRTSAALRRATRVAGCSEGGQGGQGAALGAKLTEAEDLLRQWRREREVRQSARAAGVEAAHFAEAFAGGAGGARALPAAEGGARAAALVARARGAAARAAGDATCARVQLPDPDTSLAAASPRGSDGGADAPSRIASSAGGAGAAESDADVAPDVDLDAILQRLCAPVDETSSAPEDEMAPSAPADEVVPSVPMDAPAPSYRPAGLCAVMRVAPGEAALREVSAAEVARRRARALAAAAPRAAGESGDEAESEAGKESSPAPSPRSNPKP